jgi:hypothetical protein
LSHYTKAIKKLLGSKALQLKFKNDEQLTNDGMRLEAEVVGAMILASHANGFAGITFKNLLLNFLCQMDICRLSNVIPMVIYPSELEKFMCEFIPFLSPPNRAWPSYLSQGDLKFDNLKRSREDDHIDFEVMNHGITGECKDYTEPIDTAAMKEILKRVPDRSTIHLVFTMELRKSFFSRSTGGYEAFVHNGKEDYTSVLKDTVVYGLVTDNTTKQVALDFIIVQIHLLKDLLYSFLKVKESWDRELRMRKDPQRRNGTCNKMQMIGGKSTKWISNNTYHYRFASRIFSGAA